MSVLEKQMLAAEPDKIANYLITDNGIFPGSVLPVLLYKQAFDLPNAHAPGVIEEVFEDNNWSNSWRDGIFEYHHYHSITHEVIGVYSGTCLVMLGGDDGVQIAVEQGDVLIIPAGVAHKNIGSSKDFKCIGAYPDGAGYDINTGKPGERPKTDHNIRRLNLPDNDPLYGRKGCIWKYWKSQPAQLAD